VFDIWENSQIKKDVFHALMDWNYSTEKATAFNIAKKLKVSESSVIKVLRVLGSEDLAHSHKGSWVLV